MTLCDCVSSRLGRVSATGKQGSPDATDWTLRKEDSAQLGVSSLPHGKIKMGRPRGKKTNYGDGKSSRATQDLDNANMRMWRNQNRCADAKRHHIECNSRCFDRANFQSIPPRAKKPNLSARSDVKNLQPSLRMSLSSRTAETLMCTFQSSWSGASGGKRLGKLTAACHSCTSTPMTLCARSFFSGIVSHHALTGSLRLGKKAALMPKIGLCAKKTLHSGACRLSRCMPRSQHVPCIRAVRVGPKSRFASLLASFIG